MHIYKIYTIAYKTIKVFWMPCVAQGGDEALHDGPLAVDAFWHILLVVVVLLPVSLHVLLVEPLVTEMLATQHAEEILRMPVFPRAFIQCWRRYIDRMVI